MNSPDDYDQTYRSVVDDLQPIIYYILMNPQMDMAEAIRMYQHDHLDELMALHGFPSQARDPDPYSPEMWIA